MHCNPDIDTIDCNCDWWRTDPRRTPTDGTSASGGDMAFFPPKHSSAATARLTEDPDLPRPRGPPPPRPSSASEAPARDPRSSPGKHRRLESGDWTDRDATLVTRSTSSADDDTDDDDSDYSEGDDCDCASEGGASRCSSRSSGGLTAGWSLSEDLARDDGDARSVTSRTSATTDSSFHSLTEVIGDYNDGDLQTLNQLVNKLHAFELAKENASKTPRTKNSKRRIPPPPPPASSSPPPDLPSELPVDPPHFSPLQSDHRLSISSVDSWRGPSLEVVPTEDVEHLLPLWKSQWKTDRREWEERRRYAEEAAFQFKRSRTHNDAESNHSIGLGRRNRSMPSTMRRHHRVRVAGRTRSTTSSLRNYRYGKPPTLPHAKNPNPMVSKSSKKINRKHARYALTAGMMLGIRESVGGATGVENELEIRKWEQREKQWMEEGLALAEAENDGEEGGEEEGGGRPRGSSSRDADADGGSRSSPPSPGDPSASRALSVSTLTHECDRASKYKFPPDQFYLGSNTSRPLPHKYKFKVYAPLVFARIRSLFGVEKQTFLHSICGKFNFYEFASNARSGQFFFYSHDGRYMIKTLTYAESKFLREILPHYYRHLTRFPSTFLTHFYGMYRVCMPNARNQRLHFIIMRSVFHTEKKIDRVWDLKGSRTGRKAGEGDGVGKDLDILEEGRKLRFARPKARGAFLEQLARDATFLARLGIMDYSLLLGLHNCEEEGCDCHPPDGDGDVVPATPGDGMAKEPVRSNTPFRRGILMRASSDGEVRAESDGFKALEACGNNTKGSSSRTEEITPVKPACRRSVSTGSTSESSAMNAIPESPSTTASTSSGNKPADPREAVSASAAIPKNSISSRLDMGIDGYGVKPEDGTLAKREIYFCGELGPTLLSQYAIHLIQTH